MANEKEKILELLKKKPQTTYDLCVAGFAGSYRQRISDLRKDGHKILCETKRVLGERHSTFYYKGKLTGNEVYETLFTDYYEPTCHSNGD